jgi:cardiolipin synthase
LIEAGVKIYEYLPGFVHGKMFLSDDEIAVVGTINLDYRSLYLHFECATWIYQNSAIKDIKKDIEATFEVSQRVSGEDANQVSLYWRCVRALLRVFAPLL